MKICLSALRSLTPLSSDTSKSHRYVWAAPNRWDCLSPREEPRSSVMVAEETDPSSFVESGREVSGGDSRVNNHHIGNLNSRMLDDAEKVMWLSDVVASTPTPTPTTINMTRGGAKIEVTKKDEDAHHKAFMVTRAGYGRWKVHNPSRRDYQAQPKSPSPGGSYAGKSRLNQVDSRHAGLYQYRFSSYNPTNQSGAYSHGENGRTGTPQQVDAKAYKKRVKIHGKWTTVMVHPDQGNKYNVITYKAKGLSPQDRVNSLSVEEFNEMVDRIMIENDFIYSNNDHHSQEQ